MPADDTPDESREDGARQRLDVHERRARIFRAAQDAFAACGYDRVSTAQIAAASGSSQALVFHYFGSKADLYAAVVQHAIEDLQNAQEAADEALSPGVPVRDRVRASLQVYLDHIATHPTAWSTPLRGGGEPGHAHAIRAQARAEYVERLAHLLDVHGWQRHTYALWGYFGFLDQACLHWVDLGCPDDQRNPLVEAALGALQGALGDWAV